MRTCDDEYPELHLEALVSRGGMIHYAREEERRAGKIFFRKQMIHDMTKELERDPYAYENTRFQLELTLKDILDGLDGDSESAVHAAAVFERAGMALGSGIYSLTTTIEAPVRHVVILHQLDENFAPVHDILKKAVSTSLSHGTTGDQEWKVAFIQPDVELFVLAGASLCYE